MNGKDGRYILWTDLIFIRIMLKLYEGWKEKYKGDPHKADTLERAERVYNVLKTITPN